MDGGEGGRVGGMREGEMEGEGREGGGGGREVWRGGREGGERGREGGEGGREGGRNFGRKQSTSNFYYS